MERSFRVAQSVVNETQVSNGDQLVALERENCASAFFICSSATRIDNIANVKHEFQDSVRQVVANDSKRSSNFLRQAKICSAVLINLRIATLER
jgi:hypothetical protein